MSRCEQANLASERGQLSASNKSCCWSVTINNPTEDDKAQWASLSALHWVREVSGQLESGEGGTLHIQGMVKTQSVRFAQVKKALPRAHIEPARSPAALAKYVQKQETRVAAMPTIRTATQLDVQRHCYRHVIDQCYKLEQRNQTSSLDVSTLKEDDLILKYSNVIRKNWESYTDEAVRDLIKAGYFGVEYVMANAQVRMAFKKYLPEICYRFYTNGSPQDSQDSPRPEEGTLTQENLPEGGSLSEA